MNETVIVMTRQISNLYKRNISCGILSLKEKTVVDLLKFSRECSVKRNTSTRHSENTNFKSWIGTSENSLCKLIRSFYDLSLLSTLKMDTSLFFSLAYWEWTFFDGVNKYPYYFYFFFYKWILSIMLFWGFWLYASKYYSKYSFLVKENLTQVFSLILLVF